MSVNEWVKIDYNVHTHIKTALQPADINVCQTILRTGNLAMG